MLLIKSISRCSSSDKTSNASIFSQDIFFNLELLTNLTRCSDSAIPNSLAVGLTL